MIFSVSAADLQGMVITATYKFVSKRNRNVAGVKMKLKAFIINQAHTLGFDRIGFARAESLPEEPLQRWLADGYHDGMAWMAERLPMRLDPQRLLPGARSVIVVAVNYFSAEIPPEEPHLARIARYAQVEDYHLVVKRRLKLLLECIRQLAPSIDTRICVDAAPIWEKEWARRAGIGWRGKHSLIIAPELGSWIVLGEIVTTLELPPDEPLPDRCASCTLCMEACPTGALVAPCTLDCRRCIAYHTIESSVAIPDEVQKAMGNRIFGCDICQSVCPWNHTWAHPADEALFAPPSLWPPSSLLELDGWSEERFSRAAHRTPLQRRGYDGFRRNLQAALKNLHS